MDVQPVCLLLVCTDLLHSWLSWDSQNQPKEYFNEAIVSKTLFFDIVLLIESRDNKLTVWELLYIYNFNSYNSAMWYD